MSQYGGPNTHREYATLRVLPGPNGKTEVLIRCPFDKTEFYARVWSISGGGKKCPTCGAIHGSFGMARPTNKWLEKNP